MALNGIRVIELAGLAPGPFAGMVLADLGATITRVDRTDQLTSNDLLCRGKRSIAINLKKPSGRDLLLKMIAASDVVIDPFRPGVMEKLGLGPEVFLGENGVAKSVVYARIAGFNTTSKYKDMAGHDLNYIALSGVLSLLPGEAKPAFPLNLLADFAGGGAVCALGILAALISRSHTGRGQVVQADMVSGCRYIASFPLMHVATQTPLWNMSRGQNTLDGGAPFYSVYECAKSPICSSTQYMTVACLESQFFREFISIFKNHVPLNQESPLFGVSDQRLQSDRGLWPDLHQYLEEGFKKKTRDVWSEIFHGSDACAVPMLDPFEAALASYDGIPAPLPHPFLSHTPAANAVSSGTNLTPLKPGKHTREIMKEYKIDDKEYRRLIREKAVIGDTPPAFKL